MDEEVHIPLYNGDVRDYLQQMRKISQKRQTQLLDSVSDECESVIESYWYTLLITELITFSASEQYGKNTPFFQSYIKKWSGLWARLIETLNLLFDSMILGLEGRTVSANVLLRPTLESIITGVFYHYLAQKEYRDKAMVIARILIGRNKDTFSDLVEEAIESINDESIIPLNLEAAITKTALTSTPPLRVPKVKTMLEQIGEWGIFDNPIEEVVNGLYSEWWISLSSYSHSLHEGTYIKGAMFEDDIDILLGKKIDFVEFKVYSQNFSRLCRIILIFYLNSTEELQRINIFSAKFSEFLRKYPAARKVLHHVIEQIEHNIKSGTSNLEK